MKCAHDSPDKIRYLTMTDASKVWMPDTFFRSLGNIRLQVVISNN